MGTVLGKCTDLEKCEPAVGRENIGPKGIADRHYGPNHRSCRRNVQEPSSEHLHTPGGYIPQITAHEIILRNQHANQQTPRERRVEHMQPLQPSRKGVPNRRI